MAEQLFYKDIAELKRHEGRFQVELGLPQDSSLSSRDIDRILSISSWDGDINNQIDGTEGMRSVLITKDQPRKVRDIELKGLQISGVGYKPSNKISDTSPLVPPSVDNFYDLEIGETVSRTGDVKNGKFIASSGEYTPIGAYAMDEWTHKIKSTQTASSLPVSFYTPKVEAYGKYSNLEHNGENLGFLVFSIPDVNLRRFNPQFAYDFLQMPDYTGDVAMKQFEHVGSLLGKSAWELHKNRYVHRQLHLGNFYYLQEQDNLFIMDWSTMKPLAGTRYERSMLKAIDIIVPLRGFESVLDDLNREHDYETRAMLKMHVFHEQLQAYAGATINQTIELYTNLELDNRKPLVDWINRNT